MGCRDERRRKIQNKSPIPKAIMINCPKITDVVINCDNFQAIAILSTGLLTYLKLQ
jgi:hypothetical protein